MKGSREDSARERPNRMQGLVLLTARDLILPRLLFELTDVWDVDVK
jgi:hypothetical protein